MNVANQPGLPVLPDGYRLVALDAVDSTNAHAARLTAEGETGPLWIWARQQTAGRGRRGRDWVSRPGNLYATLLLTLPVAAATAPQLGFLAALAIHGMIGELLPGPALLLKWPNDVLLDGAKISGVLSESLGPGADGRLRLAVGCGVNLAHAPHDTRYGATCVAAHGAAGATPDAALQSLARGFDRWLSVWAEGRGFDEVAAAWMARTWPLGRPMRITVGSDQIAGRFAGLTSSGALVLEQADGKKRSFHSGEVVSTALE